MIYATSKISGNTVGFRMKFASIRGAKFDVFVNTSTGAVVYRDSIRRRYEAI